MSLYYIQEQGSVEGECRKNISVFEIFNFQLLSSSFTLKQNAKILLCYIYNMLNTVLL